MTYSREHLPPFAPVGNPQGHRLHGRLHFAAGHAERSRVNSGFLGMEEERRPLGRHCVDTVFGHFEQCYLRQCGALGQSIILLLDQHRWLFILDLWYQPTSNDSNGASFFPSLSGLCPWEFVMVVFSSKHLVIKVNWVFFSQSNVKVIHCRDGNV